MYLGDVPSIVTGGFHNHPLRFLFWQHVANLVRLNAIDIFPLRKCCNHFTVGETADTVKNPERVHIGYGIGFCPFFKQLNEVVLTGL